MPTPYTPDAFSTRVNFAVDYIRRGRNTTRRFDTCFEMWDGDAVAVAVYRRMRHDPDMRRKLWRYVARASVLPLAFRERRRSTRNLPVWAAELREKARLAGERWQAELAAEKAAKKAAAIEAGYSIREVPKSNERGSWSAWCFIRPDGTESAEIHHEDSAWHYACEDSRKPREPSAAA